MIRKGQLERWIMDSYEVSPADLLGRWRRRRYVRRLARIGVNLPPVVSDPEGEVDADDQR